MRQFLHLARPGLFGCECRLEFLPLFPGQFLRAQHLTTHLFHDLPGIRLPLGQFIEGLQVSILFDRRFAHQLVE